MKPFFIWKLETDWLRYSVDNVSPTNASFKYFQVVLIHHIIHLCTVTYMKECIVCFPFFSSSDATVNTLLSIHVPFMVQTDGQADKRFHLNVNRKGNKSIIVIWIKTALFASCAIDLTLNPSQTVLALPVLAKEIPLSQRQPIITAHCLVDKVLKDLIHGANLKSIF